ncbi:hypothetical protein B0T22DRAFT_271374 [Podospora appendiculata]|uniref:Uncharacterized protein n=1 Tax=Podospora appendiculata TaxID=314037 RepID=A0AAE1C9L5_9PEZI|nr:hypothetical protein B0T22DRAFT_271374 [Podospora appendiculata]
MNLRASITTRHRSTARTRPRQNLRRRRVPAALVRVAVRTATTLPPVLSQWTDPISAPSPAPSTTIDISSTRTTIITTTVMMRRRRKTRRTRTRRTWCHLSFGRRRADPFHPIQKMRGFSDDLRRQSPRHALAVEGAVLARVSGSTALETVEQVHGIRYAPWRKLVCYAAIETGERGMSSKRSCHLCNVYLEWSGSLWRRSVNTLCDVSG